MYADDSHDYLIHDLAAEFGEIRVTGVSERLSADLFGDTDAGEQQRRPLDALLTAEGRAAAAELLAELAVEPSVEGSVTFRTAENGEKQYSVQISRLLAGAEGQAVWRMSPSSEPGEGSSEHSLFGGLAHRLSGVSSPREAALAILDLADQLFGWDSCNLNIYEDNLTRTHTIISFDEVDGRRTEMDAPTFSKPLSPMSQRVIDDGRQLILFDPTEGDDGHSELNSFGDEVRRSASLMFVPVRRGDEHIGVLTIQSYKPNAYTRRDLSLLQVLADYCSGALARTMTERKLVAQAALTEKFAHLGQQLAAARTAPEAARLILERARELFGWDAAFFYLCSPDGHRVFDGVAFDTIGGECCEMAPLLDQASPTPLIARCIREGAVLFKRPKEKDTLDVSSSRFGDTTRPSAELIFVPIHYMGSITGVFSIQSYTHDTYSQENLAAVQALADHCGGALARIFAETEARRGMERLQTMTAQIPAIIWTTDRDLRLTLLAGGGLRQIGWDESEFVGTKLQDALADDIDYDLVVRRHRKSLAGDREKYELEWGGNVYECHLEPLRDAHGEIVGCLNIARDITERKNAEADLQKFHRAIEETPNGIVLTDANHLIEYVNPAFTRLTQYELDDIAGLPIQVLEPIEDELDPEAAELLRESSEVYGGIALRHRKDGKAFYGIEIEKPILDGLQRPINYVRVCVDVTQQVESARELRRAHAELERRVEERTSELSLSNDRLQAEVIVRRAAEERAEHALSLQRATLESTFDAIAAVDLNGRLVLWNSRWLENWNLDEQELLASGKGFYESVLSQIREPEKLAMRAAEVQTQSGVEIFEVLQHRDGRVFETYSKPQMLGGEIVGWVWSFRDVTQRARAEEALAKSEAIYREAIERAAGVPYRMIYGLEGYDFIGEGVEKLLGIPASQVTKKKIAEMKQAIEILDVNAAYDFNNYADMVQRGEVDQYRVDLHLRVGNEDRWINDCSVPLRDEETGKVIGTLGILQDITDRKRFEQQFRLQQERIVRTEKLVALGTLVSGVAHEINNPNNFIMLNAPLFAEIWTDILPILDEYAKEHGDFLLARIGYGEIRGEVPRLLQGIQEGAKRIQNIVAELRDFARPRDEGLREQVAINDVVQSALVLLKNVIDQSTTNFSVSLADDLPLVLGSFQRLEQVIINLVQNACQAITDDQQAVHVSTLLLRKPARVCFRVQDAGGGIEEENLNQISDPFFTTKREIGGIGLGLSITSSIVNEHEGTIEFESVAGEGTTVIVCLPAAGETALAKGAERNGEN